MSQSDGQLTSTAQPKPRKVRWFAIAIVLLAVGTATVLFFATRDAQLDPRQLANRVRELSTGCKQAKAARNWSRMEQLAVEWTKLQPQQLEPWFMAADAAKQLGQLERVAAYLENAPKDCPIDVLYILGQLQLEELHQPKKAMETFHRTLARFPADNETHMRLMFLYTMTCQREQIIAQARQCIAKGGATPAVFGYLFAARWLVYNNGYELNQAWLKADPENELYDVAATVHLFANLNLKEMALAQGSTKTPTEFYEELLDKAIERHPKNIELMAVKLRHRSQSGDAAAVAEILSNAPPETSKDPRFWHYKGWYHAAVEQWPEAKLAYEKALEIDPYDWLTRHELASVLRRMGSIESAAEMQKQAALGKEIAQAIRFTSAMDEISKERYELMVNYFRTCGDLTTANQLRICLDRFSGPVRP